MTVDVGLGVAAATVLAASDISTVSRLDEKYPSLLDSPEIVLPSKWIESLRISPSLHPETPSSERSKIGTIIVWGQKICTSAPSTCGSH